MSDEMIERVGDAIYAERGNSDAQARAAIAAMREPTAAMIDAAVEDEGADPEWARIHWQVMIDAALK